ncbi:AMP-binding protein [Streptomyces sp. BE20]|uniref:AMP-binding protein n=1 Tax=Streptomyces sp. BE20 TaxID=3002525 RepID=UPI002E771246|nr:AMP-binding protein [Streptomyces sp. BE20]MEE1826287.1 AMP-binding protein [Streptomyces sp. BE20]
MTGTDVPVGIGSGRAGTLHGRFEEHARRTPDAVAVRCAGRELSYAELDARADRLARHLAARGLTPGRRAAVAFGRGTEVYVALLAVLKTGAAYVPLEPSAPDPLLRHVLAEADPILVVTEESHRLRLSDAGARALVCGDPAAAGIAELPSLSPAVAVGPEDPAVVFTTSGTTGAPRCIPIEHRNLLALHRGWHEVYGLSPADRILTTASLEFDVFTSDWVRALCSGATLVVAPRNHTLDRSADIADLPALVASERITVLELNVRTARRLTAHLVASDTAVGAVHDAVAGGRSGGPLGGLLSGVRVLTVGADKFWLDEHLMLRQLLGPSTRVINVYGLAEAAVDSTWYEPTGPGDVAGSAQISLVGVPFPGVRVYVLGPDRAPAPPGTLGEIALAGPGLGRGYLNHADETAQRYAHVAYDPDGRVLLTGDYGRLRPGGVLEFVARASTALGEPGLARPVGAPVTLAAEAAVAGVVAHGVETAARAEALLRAHPGVREAVVTVVQVSPTRRETVGYAVVEPGATGVDGWSLTSYLADRLPEHGTPAAVVPLTELPRTRAGKLDHGALPLPAPADHTAPRRAVGAKGGGGKGGGRARNTVEARGAGCVGIFVALAFSVLAWVFTDALWPGSTDVSAVPAPYDTYFQVLYLFEWGSFGLGVVWLLAGPGALVELGRPFWLSVATYLSVFWLLASWWPQDNMYRTSAKADWSRQSLLVYVFNVALMVSAAVVVRFMLWDPPAPARDRRRGRR